MPEERLIGKKEVEEITGLRYVTIWKRMKANTFPRSVVLGKGTAARVAWRYSEVIAWLESSATPVMPRHWQTGRAKSLDGEEGWQRRGTAGSGTGSGCPGGVGDVEA
jgi:predicted DNA-binding transcriptional regulator AlpA